MQLKTREVAAQALQTVLTRDPESAGPLLARVLVSQVVDPADEMLGATLQSVGDVLRAQLDIPAGQGLLVAALRDDGPSSQAGLKQNDILLTLADKPLTTAADVTKLLKAAGESGVPLKAIRAGKPITIQVRPIYRVTIGPAAEQKTEYYIGVSLDPPDNALRTQLGLPADQGVVVTDVVSGSPAEKAGVKKYDIVLELGGKSIENVDSLTRNVQAAQDKPTTLKVLRGGKPVLVEVTGAVRKVEVNPGEEGYRIWMLPYNNPLYGSMQVVRNEGYPTTFAEIFTNNSVASGRYVDNVSILAGAPAARVVAAGGEDLRQRLDQLEKELKAVRAALDRIGEALKTERPKQE